MQKRGLYAEVLYYLSGAGLDAVAALGALGNIHHREIIHHCDGALRALTGTLGAGDTAKIAVLHDFLALGLAGTAHDDPLACRDEFNNALGAGLYTGAAAYTLVPVNLCHTVYNVHSAKGTGFCTVAQTDAGESAHLVGLAAKEHGRTAVLRAFVIEAGQGMAGSAGAGHKCHHFLRLARCNAHYLSHSRSTFRAARHAAVGGSLTGSYSSGVTVTAGIAAAAAVCACKAGTDSFLLGVNFHMEDFGGKGQ